MYILDADTSLGEDLRSSQRVEAPGMMALIYGKLLKVIDASEGGLKMEGASFDPGQRLDFTLYRSIGTKLDLNGGVQGAARVVWSRDGRMGVAFDPPTMALMTLIVRHVAAVLGTSPTYFK